jgi:molybdopterin/thiamine biosynthesis adenylyltransferase
MVNMGLVGFLPSFRTWNYINTEIVIVGCGGTGGRLVPTIAQHIANHNKEVAKEVRNDNKIYLNHPLKLILIDMDIVESKNLKRQNFYAFDIGKNKAQCLADRYSALNGIAISYYDKKFSEAKESLGRDNLIIFDCTDNLDARKSIEECGRNAVLISCGNEDTFGQVVVSTISTSYNNTDIVDTICTLSNRIAESVDQNRAHPNTYRLKHLPSLLTMFPDFKDTETASCTEIQLVNEQSMPINSLVAQLAYNAFYDIVSEVPLKYNIVKCSVQNSFSTHFINNPVTALDVLVPAFTLAKNSDEVLKSIHAFKSNRNINTYSLRYKSPAEIVEILNKNNCGNIAAGVLRSTLNDLKNESSTSPERLIEFGNAVKSLMEV